MTKVSAQINRPVGVDKYGEIYCVEEFFNYPKLNQDGPLYGVTGLILRPVSQAEYDYQTSQAGLEERFEEFWQMAVDEGQTRQSLEDYARDVYWSDGDDAVFDQSGFEFWDDLRQYFPEDDYPIFECIGAGRIFYDDTELETVYDPTLYALVRVFEAQNGSPDMTIHLP